MANKVAVFQDIVAELSALTNTSEALCSTFLKSFFALISERMADGVKVDKIGKFGIAGDKVVYQKYAGTEIKVDGEEYIIVRQSDILAVVE